MCKKCANVNLIQLKNVFFGNKSTCLCIIHSSAQTIHFCNCLYFFSFFI